MINRAYVLAGAAALALSTVPAGAVTISYDHSHDAFGVPTSSVAGARSNDFNHSSFTSWTNGANPVIGTTVTGGGAQFVSGDQRGRYAAPYISDGPAAGTDDPTVYVSVPSSSSSGSLLLVLNTTFNYFGLFWGSIDAYNSIAFLLNGAQVAAFTGSDVTSPNAANGNQTAPGTNTYVNFLDLGDFNEVRFSSNGYAFEFDNIALANIGGAGTAIAEPATLGLLGLGFASLAFAARRRSTF